MVTYAKQGYYKHNNMYYLTVDNLYEMKIPVGDTLVACGREIFLRFVFGLFMSPKISL